MNKTDPDSRMMRTQGQPTVQGYNAQAAVTRGQIIVAAEIAVESPDFGHLEPAVRAALRELDDTGVTQRPGDRPGRRGLLAHPADRDHRQRAASKCWSRPTPGYARTPDRDGTKARTRSCAECSPPRLDTRSTSSAKPQSSRSSRIMNKFNRGFRRFQRRGRSAVRSEWRLQAAVHNLLKLHSHWISPAIA